MNSATVNVRLMLEVHSHGAWGQDCTISQAKDQGVKDALARLQRIIGEHPGIKALRVEAVDIVLMLENGK